MHLYTMANNGEKCDCNDHSGFHSHCQMREMSDSFLLQRSRGKIEDRTDGRFTVHTRSHSIIVIKTANDTPLT